MTEPLTLPELVTAWPEKCRGGVRAGCLGNAPGGRGVAIVLSKDVQCVLVLPVLTCARAVWALGR